MAKSHLGFFECPFFKKRAVCTKVQNWTFFTTGFSITLQARGSQGRLKAPALYDDSPISCPWTCGTTNCWFCFLVANIWRKHLFVPSGRLFVFFSAFVCLLAFCRGHGSPLIFACSFAWSFYCPCFKNCCFLVLLSFNGAFALAMIRPLACFSLPSSLPVAFFCFVVLSFADCILLFVYGLLILVRC